MAQIPLPENGPLFLQDGVSICRVSLDQDSLDQMLNEDNWYSDHEYPATFIYETDQGSDTIHSVGFRLRGNTSREAGKKSFKISINSFIPGQKFHGVEKINLNGHQNDPSMMRAKLSWDAFREAGIPGCRTSFVKLYINEEYKGLYTNVEHVDEEFVQTYFGSNTGDLFKCLYPADLNYWGSDPDDYKEEFWGRRAYDLKTNTQSDDYNNLTEFITILNLTDDDSFQCEIEKIFNVLAYLKTLALEVLIGHWDGYAYNKNNYYLYQNPSTGKFEYLEYDLDNTLGIDWVNSNWSERDIHEWSNPWEYRPLYERIMTTPLYQNQYNYILEEYRDTFFNLDVIDERVDAYYDLISEAATEDEYRALDFDFTLGDFENAYTVAWGDHVSTSIEQYIDERAASLDDFIEDSFEPLSISYSNDNGPQAESVLITAQVIGQNPIVNCNISVNNASWFMLTMEDNGLNGDEAEGDGIFSLELFVDEQDQHIEYQVIAENAFSQGMYPCEPKWVWVSESDNEMVINELMASNITNISDELGEFDDWIELHNPSLTPINLHDLYLTDNLNNPMKWPLPDVTVNQGDFILFWADGTEEQGALHTNFNLSSEGEKLALIAIENDAPRLVDFISFPESQIDESYGREQDANPNWIWFASPTPDASNNSVSIGEIRNDILTWPNPTTGLLHFSQSMAGRVISTLGKEVYSFGPSKEIHVGHLTPGLYFIQTENKVFELIVR